MNLEQFNDCFSPERETLVVAWSATDYLVYEGEAGAVTIDWEEFKAQLERRKEKAVVIHNHPDNGMPSVADRAMAITLISVLHYQVKMYIFNSQSQKYYEYA